MRGEISWTPASLPNLQYVSMWKKCLSNVWTHYKPALINIHADCLCSPLWRWKVLCVCVCVRLCVWACVWTWCSDAATHQPPQQSRPARLCSHMFTRIQDQSTDIMVSISRKRGHWSTHRALPPQFPPYLSSILTRCNPFVLSLYSFVYEQCFLSVLPLISLLCSHSLITLFSLCGKCQVCRWRYLHENWRTKALGHFSQLLPSFDIWKDMQTMAFKCLWRMYIILTAKSGALRRPHFSF